MIKLGYCVAYDWDLLRYSIPKIYEHTDVICLSIDKNRQSWTGEFFSWVNIAPSRCPVGHALKM